MGDRSHGCDVTGDTIEAVTSGLPSIISKNEPGVE
jgi:hypothetical protein